MRDAVQKKFRPNRTGGATLRLAVLAAFGGFALTVLALPIGLESAGLMKSPAFAAGENNSTNGTEYGKAPVTQSIPGNDAESALAETDESVESPTIVPIAKSGPANANVIKEIAGLAGDEELSDEEEREAIQSGWGTWRTADGPETVVAQ